MKHRSQIVGVWISYSSRDVLPFCIIGLQQTQVGVPLVPNNLSTGKATNWDNHCLCWSVGFDTTELKPNFTLNILLASDPEPKLKLEKKKNTPRQPVAHHGSQVRQYREHDAPNASKANGTGSLISSI